MGMFSEMLHELDRNTTRYMVYDMKEKIKRQGETIAELQGTVTEQREALAEKDEALAGRDGTITEQQRIISEQKAALEAMEAEIKRLSRT